MEIKHDVFVSYSEHIGPIVGLAFALLIAGCSGVKPPAPAAQPPTAAAAVAPTPSPAPVPSPQSAAVTPSSAAAPEPTNPPVAPPVTPSQSAAKPIPPVAKASTAVAPKAPVVPLPKKESPAPDVAKKAPPTLDLKSLEQRLKDTSAIGVLTKIALKNQVDDLLDQFRAFYQGKLKTTLAELRQPYDLLVLKVLSLLQDSDPSLASAIVASREAIWGILADPKKFATI
jgi:hypothetical protein